MVPRRNPRANFSRDSRNVSTRKHGGIILQRQGETHPVYRRSRIDNTKGRGKDLGRPRGRRSSIVIRLTSCKLDLLYVQLTRSLSLCQNCKIAAHGYTYILLIIYSRAQTGEPRIFITAHVRNIRRLVTRLKRQSVRQSRLDQLLNCHPPCWIIPVTNLTPDEVPKFYDLNNQLQGKFKDNLQKGVIPVTCQTHLLSIDLTFLPLASTIVRS